MDVWDRISHSFRYTGKIRPLSLFMGTHLTFICEYIALMSALALLAKIAA